LQEQQIDDVQDVRYVDFAGATFGDEAIAEKMHY